MRRHVDVFFVGVGIGFIGLVILNLVWGHPSSQVLWMLRFPRVLNALWVGILLATSGAVFQGVLRNPLAEPYTLGFSAGTAVGVLGGIALGWPLGGSVALGICTGVGSMLILLRFFRSALHLLLAGVALNFFAGAFLVMLQAFVEPFRVYAMVRWSMGNLSTVGPVGPALALGFTLLWWAWIWRHRYTLQVATLGENVARSLGLDWASWVRRFVLYTGVLLSLSVARVGPIGFVGLVIPHLVRMQRGAEMKRLLPGSALLGSTFLLGADFLGHLGNRAIPVGAITALVGTPVFVWILWRNAQNV